MTLIQALSSTCSIALTLCKFLKFLEEHGPWRSSASCGRACLTEACLARANQQQELVLVLAPLVLCLQRNCTLLQHVLAIVDARLQALSWTETGHIQQNHAYLQIWWTAITVLRSETPLVLCSVPEGRRCAPCR